MRTRTPSSLIPAGAKRAGLQDIVDVVLSRRQVLGGLVASASVVPSAHAQAADGWWDIRFDLSKDGRVLTIVEVFVSEAPNSDAAHADLPEPKRVDRCRWRVPAAAFGPAAWFDMARPAGPVGRDHALPRQVIIRDASYGLRVGVTIAFRLTRDGAGLEAGRWRLVYDTDLWISSQGATLKVASSPPVGFEAFLRDTPASETLAGTRVAGTLARLFNDHFVLSGPASQTFTVTLDRDLVWRTKAKGKGGLTAFTGQVTLRELAFAWHRTAERNFFFAGEATVLGPDLPATISLGDPHGHRVAVASVATTKAAGLPLQVRVEPSPLKPAQAQVVLGLLIGSAEISIANGKQAIVGPFHAGNLMLSCTALPGVGSPIRTVLWGDALGPDPAQAATTGNDPVAAALEITSPIGRLFVGPPVLEILAEPKKPKSDGAATQPPTDPDGAADPGSVDAAPAETSERDAVERFFQVANGDKGGARGATVFALDDRPSGKPTGRLRRVAVDLSLIEACAAIPDASYSRLTFAEADLKLLFEDGEALSELRAGEYPALRPSSFVWVGPLAAGAGPRAALDLSRARLLCARDYDLMKLGFRFHDLTLDFNPGPVIRPSRQDCRVLQLEGGLVEDSRPVLVAEFGPQHVMEQAILRPPAPPLPDVELKDPIDLGDGKTVHPQRGSIVAYLCTLKDASSRKAFRDKVQAAKIGLDPSGLLKPFAEAFAEAVASVRDIPVDQRVYIGPFALDADAMALARDLHNKTGEADIARAIAAMHDRLDAAYDAIKAADKLRPVRKGDLVEPGSGDPVSFFRNALFNEGLLEQQDDFYALYRDYWRERAIERGVEHPDAGGDEAARQIAQQRTEYVLAKNRPDGFTYESGAESAFETAFIDFARGQEPVPDLVGARLSGPSRLAFRLNCQPVVGLDAEEAGLAERSPPGPSHPGSGAGAYAPIPFTFEALTDWSRHEPAVAQRARKLFKALPSGLLPPLGNRAADVDDQAILRFQGIAEGATTAAHRMTQVRASLEAAPTELETAIEIPARLVLSPAQDAVWRTLRRLPPPVLAARGPDPIQVGDAPEIVLQSGRFIEVAGEPAAAYRTPLWSVRLAVDDVPPSLRAIASPDLRPMALVPPPQVGQVRRPGEGAPPPGAYAPWFIGRESLDSGVITAEAVNDTLPGHDKIKGDVCQPGSPDTRSRLIRWLCERFKANAKPAMRDRDFALFRTSLDAYDRHQLVLLCSAHGLPVTGSRQRVGDDVEVAGGLVAESGQIDPGDVFPLLDAHNDQAIYRPIPLAVRELSLTALGGSLLHDTTFKPAVGADDLWGRKIFDGFSIQRWQHEIVLGRDRRAEVVYKGYLFPIGHKASLIKITERVFLRTPKQGIKAILRQRRYLDIAKPAKEFPAVGHPHAGRMWCGHIVNLLTTQTPDLIDPHTVLADKKTEKKPFEDPSGLLNLPGPGIGFWPRTDLTPQGLLNFELDIDGAKSELPMIFLDNIAATNRDNVKSVAAYYNDINPKDPRRTLAFRGQKIRFAPEKKPGDTTFLTQAVVLRAQGREEDINATWTGDLTRYLMTGVLEGAEQPPFYPAVAHAAIRLEQAERFSGKPMPVEVQYDGHYVLNGFPDSRPGNAPKLDDADENPLEIFLDMRRVVKIDMGSNGDRSAAVARPNTNVIAWSRTNGPMGGDGSVWWQKGPTVAPEPELLKDGELTTVTSNETDLVSLAAYFNSKRASLDLNHVAAATSSGSGSGAASASRPADTGGRVGEALRQLQIVQSYFSDDAKLLGTVKLKDLMVLLDVKPDTLPVLKEVVEYGTAAAHKAEEGLADLATDVKTRILVPLQSVVARLREQWAKLDQDIAKAQADLPGSGGADRLDQHSAPLTLATIYPEIDTSLKGVDTALNDAIATDDAIALTSKLAELYESAKRLVRAIEVVAANPVERLQDAVGADIRRRLSVITEGLRTIAVVGGMLKGIIKFAQHPDPALITDWILAHVVPADAKPDAVDAALSDQLSLAIRAVDLSAVANSFLPDPTSAVRQALDEVAKDFAKNTHLAARDLLRTLVESAVVQVLGGGADIGTVVRGALAAFAKSEQKALSAAAKQAKEALDKIAADTADTAVLAAKAAMRTEIDAFSDYVEKDLVPQIEEAAAESVGVALLVEAGNRVVLIFDRVLVLRDAVTGGKAEAILPAAAAFAQDVLGVDIAGTLDDLRAKLDVIGKAINGQQTRLLEGLGWTAVSSDILAREVAACALYRADPVNQADAVPVRDTGNKPVGSIPESAALGDAIGALQDAQSANDGVIAALADNKAGIAAALGDATYGTCTSFTTDVTRLLTGDGTPASPGLRGDSRQLYCALVDALTSLRVPSTPAPLAAGATAPAAPALGTLEQWAIRARALRRAADGMGAAVASIMRQITAFAERNGPVLGMAAGLAIVADQVAKNGGLSAEAKKTFADLAARERDAERKVADALRLALNAAIKLLTMSAIASTEQVEAARKASTDAANVLKSTAAGQSLDRLAKSLADLQAQLASVTALKTIDTSVDSLSDLRGRKIRGNDTAEQVFAESADPKSYQSLVSSLRAVEASAVAAWRNLRQQILGVPDLLKSEVEKAILASGALGALSDVYAQVRATRDDVLTQLDSLRVFRRAARHALLVPRGGCAVDDINVGLGTVLGCDGLATDAATLADLTKRSAPLDPDSRAALLGILRGWQSGKAAPLLVVTRSRDIAVDLLRGNIFAVIDLNAFRDQIEDTIAGLIPTRATLNYDFASRFNEQSKNNEDKIFQPKQGESFGLAVRATVDLLAQKKATFQARGHIGAFDIKLIGGLVDALTLQFGGASFVLEDGTKPRFDVNYTSFVIGRDLQFVKQLESYLLPEEGNGVFVQPLTRGAGIEAGYGINLGTLSIGNTSFLNVTLNVSAELPFDNHESLFKVSLGRRLAPFTMSVLPFAGSGYFSIFAAANGVRGFEASFEFGGGGALKFGPLTAQARIQVGVFVRVLNVDGTNVTTIYGTFFAGGSASIWIFHFATSLSVRLGSSGGGAMYGEATFTFSFSLGLADYDYSVTATKNEPAIGSGSAGKTSGKDGHAGLGGPIRYAALVDPNHASDAGSMADTACAHDASFPPAASALFDGTFFDSALLSPIEVP